MTDPQKEDKIVKLLSNQNALLTGLIGQVKTLVNLPTQVSVVETKLNFMASVHAEMHTMNTDLNRVGTKVSNHSLVMTLLGAAMLAGLPILATWNYQLRSEITELQRVTTQLEERVRRLGS